VAIEIEGVNRVEIHCDPGNLYSAAVPRKLGYTHEGTLRARTIGSNGLPSDSMIWTLFKEDYPNSPSASAQIEAYDATGQRIL
jgi:RimJ/RimL family protein N-acetyltransferase